jgi:hypothetical protein
MVKVPELPEEEDVKFDSATPEAALSTNRKTRVAADIVYFMVLVTQVAL